jgi:hypothetical protein
MKSWTQIFIIAICLIPNCIWAGGGWIANGIGGNISTLNEFNFSESSEPHERNYFLLPEGEKSVTLGMVWIPEQINETILSGSSSQTLTRTDYSTSPAILFSWGISKNWTWSNYFSLRYNLYSAGRTDLAISFGPAEGGLGYATGAGFYMAPGGALLHSLNLGFGMRLVNELEVSGRFQSTEDADNDRFSFNMAKLSTSISKTFANTVTFSVGGLTYAGYRRSLINGQIRKHWGWHVLLADPTFGVSAALGNHSELGLSVSLDHASPSREGGPTTVLYLSTRF